MAWNRTAILAALPVAAVAVIAGIVSFSHIEALGRRTGQSITNARLLPLAVDGLIVAGSVILLAGSWLGWIGVALGVAGTLYANVRRAGSGTRPPSHAGRGTARHRQPVRPRIPYLRRRRPAGRRRAHPQGALRAGRRRDLRKGAAMKLLFALHSWAQWG